MSRYCPITLNGIALDCENNKGGIKVAYVAPYEDVTATVDKVTGMVETLTIAGDGKFKAYQFRKNTGSMNSTLTADETNGLNYVTTEISLVFTKMSTAKRLEMAALSLGQLAVVVEDSNGIYWLCTVDDYASASAGSGETGTAKGDRNAYTLTLSVENDSYPVEVPASVMNDLIEA